MQMQMQVYTVRTRRHRLGAEPPVVVAASIAHESEFTVVLGVAHEVGAVVKASITSAAQAVFVFVTFDVALFFGEFEARYMFYRKHGYGGSVSSSSPVVRSSSSHFVRSFVCLFRQLPSTNTGKAFQFYSSGSGIASIIKKILYFVFVVLRGQTRYTDKLRNWFAEFLPMKSIVERLCAVEMLEAQIAGKAVTLRFATVNQEFVFVIKPNTTIDTHTISMIFQFFFIRFASFHLAQKFKDETFLAIVIIATGIAAALDTRVRSSSVLLLFVNVVGSIVKPQRSHHSGSHSHFFVRSFVLRLYMRPKVGKVFQFY